jgi:hypothetical protein
VFDLLIKFIDMNSMCEKETNTFHAVQGHVG